MILLIGGLGQGQARYAAENWPQREIVGQVEELLRQEEDGEAFARRLLAEHEQAVLWANEIGCGVAPLEAGERRWREQTGRCLIYLASQAEQVFRLCCGLALRLK